MEVRPASFADVEALTRGLKAVADGGIWLTTEPGAPVEDLAKRVRRSLAEAPVRLVLVEREEVVGTIVLRETGVVGVLSIGIWVLAAHRGAGGGRLLIEAALEARPEGTHKLELECRPDNEAAIALYRAAGFEEEGLRRSHYRRRDGSLLSAVIMSRLFLD